MATTPEHDPFATALTQNADTPLEQLVAQLVHAADQLAHLVHAADQLVHDVGTLGVGGTTPAVRISWKHYVDLRKHYVDLREQLTRKFLEEVRRQAGDPGPTSEVADIVRQQQQEHTS